MVIVKGRRILYECPSCKKHNKPEEKNCKKCGHWLQSTSYPPRVIHKRSFVSHIARWAGKFISTILSLALIVGIIITVSTYYGVEIPVIGDKISSYLGAKETGINLGYKSKSFGSKTNPAPLDEKVVFGLAQQKDSNSKYYNYNVETQVNRVIRGKEALDQIYSWKGDLAEKAFKLDEGYEYLLANVTLTVLSSEDEEALEVNPFYMSLYSSLGEKYLTILSIQDRLFSATIFEKESYTGWFAYQVKKEDADPLLELIDVWFRTN